jgi:signal transduction histidine kinase
VRTDRSRAEAATSYDLTGMAAQTSETWVAFAPLESPRMTAARPTPATFRQEGRRLARRLFAQSIVCWWILGIGFSALWWLTNRHQMAWFLFCYAWEVPAIGWTGVVLLPWLRWTRIAESIEHEETESTAALLRFPQFVAVCALLTSTIGYVIGAVQLIVFAHLPTLEALKVSVQGPVLGAVLSVAAFLAAERAIRRLSSPRMPRPIGPASQAGTAYSVAWKVRYITVTIALGAAIPIFFFGLTREQRRLEELRGLALERVVTTYAASNLPTGSLVPLPEFGPHTRVYVTTAAITPTSAGLAVPFAGSRHSSVFQLAGLRLDAPTQLLTAPSGWYPSRFDGHRVVAFQRTADNLFLAVSPLADYGPAMLNAWLAAAAVGGCALAVAFLLSLSFARSIVEPLETQSDEARALADRLEHTNAELRVAIGAAEMARRDAEAANRSKSIFLANMSHELRTPLNAIQGYAELLELGVRGPVTEEQREDLRRIQHNEQHLLSVINDMLNFARLEAARVSYTIEPVSLADAVASAAAMVIPQFRKARIRLVVERIDVGCTALADADKVRQVLLNLLSNALKFTERGGTITLSVERAADRVLVRVRDTGRGIPLEKLETIFEPFVQVDPSLTRRQQGSGLGLSISRGLARGMGGDLAVETTSAAGSVFVLTLPVAVLATRPVRVAT